MLSAAALSRFLLDHGSAIDEPGSREIRAIEWATRHQDAALFELLLERGARAGDALLMDVARAGNVQLMQCLKNRGNYNLNFKVLSYAIMSCYEQHNTSLLLS